MASLSAAKMGSKRVFPLLMSMSLPPVLSMLVQSLYNIVDSMFVAKVSDSAYLAVLYAFPIQNFILSLAVGAGVGLNSYIARKLGAGDRDEADSAVTHGFLLAGVHSLLFVLLGLFFIEPFFRLFTDSAEVLSLGVSYTRIVVFLSCGTIFHITVEKIFQSVGRMVFPMLLQAAGAVINILLDPILIFGLFGFPAMGVEGAAVATIIGQMSAMLLSFLLFFFGKYDVGLRIRGFRFSMKTVRSIYAVAIPSTVMMSIASVLVMGLNAILGRFSEFAVSAFGSYYKLQTFVYMPASGLVQGMRPILSFNYGAKNRTRVMGTLRCSLLVVVLIMAAGTLLFMAAPAAVLGLFNASPEVLGIGIPALRILCTSFIVSSVGVVFSALFESLGMGKESLVISLLRQFAITLPLAFLLSIPFGLTGIWIAFPIAETAAALVSLLLFRRVRKRDEVLGR